MGQQQQQQQQTQGQRTAVTVLDLSLGAAALTGGVLGSVHGCDNMLPVLLICAGGLLILQGLLYSALLAGYGENQMVQGSLNLLGLCEFGVFVACNVLLFKLGHCFILVRVMGITYIAITYLSLIGGVVASVLVKNRKS